MLSKEARSPNTNKKPQEYIAASDHVWCAQDWTRTSMPFRAPPPQDGVSTNFTTWAYVVIPTGFEPVTHCLKGSCSTG